MTELMVVFWNDLRFACERRKAIRFILVSSFILLSNGDKSLNNFLAYL